MISSKFDNISKDNLMLATGIVAGSALTLTAIVNPTMRKITFSTYKFITKQQLKLIAGIGVLSIATYIASQCNDEDETNIIKDF